MHYPIGFPVIGLNQVEVTYPFQMPIVFFDDFFQGSSADFNTTATAPGTHYKLAGTNAATTAGTNISFVAANDGGTLRFITTGTSGDGMFGSLFTGTHAMVNSATDPRALVFQCRIMPASVADASQAVGMVPAGGLNGTTEPIGTQAFGAYFVIVNGAVQVTYRTSAITVAAAAVTWLEGPNAGSAVTIAAAVWSTFTIRFDGNGGLKFFVNGLLVKSVTLAAFTSLGLTPFWGLETTTAATKTLDIDYIYAATEAPAAGRG